MTSKEKQKAIAALKKSAPVMAVTSREYEDYIKTINKIMDWLEQPETDSKSNTSELKPCPFCGTEVKMRKVPIYGYSGRFDFEVRCPKCGCTVDYTHSDTIYRTEEEAIANVTKTWNERYVHWFERVKESEEQEPCENVAVTNKNLCNSCTIKDCMFQSGIVRNHCDFYKSESEE